MFGAPPPGGLQAGAGAGLSAAELRETFREFDLDKNGRVNPVRRTSDAARALALRVARRAAVVETRRSLPRGAPAPAPRPCACVARAGAPRACASARKLTAPRRPQVCRRS